MGFAAQVQQPQTSQSGKGASAPQQSQNINPNPPDGGSGNMPDSSNGMPSGKGGRSFTYSPTSGQQSMGSPNPYPNTIGQWDNASIQPFRQSNGKGKGG